MKSKLSLYKNSYGRLIRMIARNPAANKASFVVYDLLPIIEINDQNNQIFNMQSKSQSQVSEVEEIHTKLALAKANPEVIETIIKNNQLHYLENSTELVKDASILMFGQINYFQTVQMIQKTSASAGVCAKTLTSKDIAWKCETCEKDPTCIICQECFEKGDHKGHKIWLKRGVAGCCDCGDPDAWDEKGFCSDHKGYVDDKEKLLSNFPPYIKVSAPVTIKSLSRLLNYASLLINNKNTSKYLKPDQILSLPANTSALIQKIIGLFSFYIKISPAFILLITDALNEINIDLTTTHECVYRTFLADESLPNHVKDYLDSNPQNLQTLHRSIVPKVLDEHPCTCKVLENLFTLHSHLTVECQKEMHDFYYKLFPSFKFKSLLGNAYTVHYFQILSQKGEGQHATESLGVQVLGIPDIVQTIIYDPYLRQQYLDAFEYHLEQLLKSPNDRPKFYKFISIFYNIRYMIRTPVVSEILKKSDFVEQIIKIGVQLLQYRDTRKQRVAQVILENEGYKELYYEAELIFVKLVNSLLVEIHPLDMELNIKFFSFYYTLFQNDLEDDTSAIDKEVPQEQEEFKSLGFKTKTQGKGFSMIPLHRTFGFYVARFTLINSMNGNNHAFKQILSQIDEDTTVDKFVQKYLIDPLSKSQSFIDEIRANKWIYSGIEIKAIPQVHYHLTDRYSYLNHSLFQICFALVEDPQELFQTFLDKYPIDNWLKEFYRQTYVGGQGYNKDKFKGIESVLPFDDKKLTQQIYYLLTLLTTLQTFETNLLFTVLKKQDSSAEVHQYSEQIENERKAMYVKVLGKELVQNYFKGKPEVTYEDVQKGLDKFIHKNEQFDQVLSSVMQQRRDDASRKMKFSLKEDRFGEFDPYGYLDVSNKSEADSEISKYYDSNKLKQYPTLDPILGSLSDPISSLTCKVRQGLVKSNLIYFLSAMLIKRTSGDVDSKDLINEQIVVVAVKLIAIIMQTLRNESDQYILNNYELIFMDQEFALVNSIVELRDANQGLVKGVNYILETLIQINPDTFKSLSSKIVQTQAIEDEKAKKREAARKKQQEIMAKFAAQRQKAMNKIAETGSMEPPEPSMRKQESTLTSQTGVSTTSSRFDVAAETCCLCKEDFDSETFHSSPFGQICYITNNKLIHQSRSKVISERHKEELLKEESKLEPSESVKQLLCKNQSLSLKCLNYIDSNSNTVLTPCKHFAHYKCLNDYNLLKDKNDTYNSKELIGMKSNWFQCPLCKTLSNAILPYSIKDAVTMLRANGGVYNKENELKKYVIDYAGVDVFKDVLIQYMSTIIKLQIRSDVDVIEKDWVQNSDNYVQMSINFIIQQLISLRSLDIKDFTSHIMSSIKNTYFTVIGILEKVIKPQNIDVSQLLLQSLQASSLGRLGELKRDQLFKGADVSEVLLDAVIKMQIIGEVEQPLQNSVNQLTHYCLQLVFIQVLGTRVHDRFLEMKEKGSFDQIEVILLDELSKLDLQSVQEASIPALKALTLWQMSIGSFGDDIWDLLITIEQSDSNFFDYNDELYTLINKVLQINIQEELHYFVSNFQTTTDEQMEQKSPGDFDSREQFIQYKLQTFKFTSGDIIKQLSKVLPLKHDVEMTPTEEEEKEPQQKIQSMALVRAALVEKHEFKLVKLLTEFNECVMSYYKLKCSKCNTQPKISVLCLLCGEVKCFLQECCTPKGMFGGQGELTEHAYECGGGSSMYLDLGDGEIIMIEQGRMYIKKSPFANQYGETYLAMNRKWDQYHLNVQRYDEMKHNYVRGLIGREVMKSRCNATRLYRVNLV